MVSCQNRKRLYTLTLLMSTRDLGFSRFKLEFFQFIDAYAFSNSSQEVWWKSCKEEMELVYCKASNKMLKAGTIRSFFKPNRIEVHIDGWHTVVG